MTMRRHALMGMIAALVALLAGAPAALAGGWAMVTLDELPQEVRAGQPIRIGFVVRQHGHTPTNLGTDQLPIRPTLTISQAGDAAPLAFPARQEGPTGHFVADVTFPRAGAWNWSIDNLGYFIQDNPGGNSDAMQLAPITVLPGAPAASQPAAPAGGGLASATLLRWAGLALLLAALVALLAGQRVRAGKLRGSHG